MKYVNNIINYIIEAMMALSALVLMVVTFLGVISRFVLNLSIGWSSDVTRWSFIYAIFFGAAYAARTNSHLNLDVVISMLKPKAKAAVELIIFLLLTIFCIMIAYWGFKLTIMSGMKQRMPYLDMKIGILYAAIPINGLFMALFYLEHMIDQMKILLGKSEQGE